jgi:hypothetical protein
MFHLLYELRHGCEIVMSSQRRQRRHWRHICIFISCKIVYLGLHETVWPNVVLVELIAAGKIV